jgi:ABC-2 type transport system permease protein
MVRTAAIWGAVVAVYVYATAVGFDSLGASPSARRATLDVLASNVGLKALLGDSGRVDTVAGFIDWRVIGLMSIATAIWALMAATRWLRGEESAGRWELVLAGPITPRAATARTLTGLGSGVGALWVVAAAGTAIVARRDDVGVSPARAAFFATVIAFAPAVFLAVGAVASQLMATRARANSVGATVLGVAFMLRALGDAAPAAHWLVDVSPFGWIEQIHPLGDAHPLWLVPLAGLTAGLGWLAVALAARRDLGDSVIADRDTAPARIRMLSRPTLFAIRMARGSIAAWLGATAIAALLYGAFARSAGQVFADSSVIRKFAGTLAPTAAHLGEQTYAGIIFLLMTTLLMAYAKPRPKATSTTCSSAGSAGYRGSPVASVSRPRCWSPAVSSLALASGPVQPANTLDSPRQNSSGPESTRAHLVCSSSAPSCSPSGSCPAQPQ